MPARWSLLTRLAFRFTVVYFVLYVVCTQMLWGLISIPIQISWVQNLETLPPLRQIITWFAVHAFGANAATLQITCLLYTSPSPRDGLLSRMPSSA